MKSELAESVETIEHSVIGGDTASFRPLVLEDEEDVEDSAAEEDSSQALQAGSDLSQDGEE